MEKYNAYQSVKPQQGFALFITLVITVLVGIVAVSSLRITEMTESLAGNSIQRSRAIQAAEGALMEGENVAVVMARNRVFANASGSNGLFSMGNLPDEWWRDSTFTAAANSISGYPAVVDDPQYVVEEVGSYLSDGGSGIVSLDSGAGSYGSKTASGREVILYRLQSHGVGSTDRSQAVVESLYIADR